MCIQNTTLRLISKTIVFFAANLYNKPTNRNNPSDYMELSHV
jgi:hypothetical protein